jgi:hypothetical protein
MILLTAAVREALKADVEDIYDAAIAVLDAAPTVAVKATMHESHDAVWFNKGIDDHEYPDDVIVTQPKGEAA